MNLWTQLLIALGLRSECCGAKIYTWSLKQHHCTSCGHRLD